MLIITLFYAENAATCVFSLLLSDAPFTDRAVFSIQGQHFSHTFTVIARCWHAGIKFSLSQFASTSNAAADSWALTSASKLLLLTVVTGGNATMIEDGSETLNPWLLQCFSLKWTLSSQQWLRTRTAQHKRSLLQNGEVGGRGDKQRESDGQPECCDRGVCCSFVWENDSLCIALVPEEVCLCATLPWQTIPSPSLKVRYSLVSAVVLHCAPASYFLPF